MKLSKWYFDCVTDSGRPFIGYAATLRFGGLSIPWSASRFWDDNETLRQGFTRHSVRQEGDALHLHLPRYATDGVWEGGRACEALTLREDETTRIRWQVLRPRSRVRLRLDGRVHTGFGYVERLDLDLRVPRLPFGELHWGRFMADAGGEWCIWIGWRNGCDHTWVLAGDGATSRLWREAEFHEQAVVLPQGSVTLTPVRNLTDAAISGHFPAWLTAAFARALGAGRERKFLSRAEYCSPTGQRLSGWALHEIVTWQSATSKVVPPESSLLSPKEHNC